MEDNNTQNPKVSANLFLVPYLYHRGIDIFSIGMDSHSGAPGYFYETS